MLDEMKSTAWKLDMHHGSKQDPTPSGHDNVEGMDVSEPSETDFSRHSIMWELNWFKLIGLNFIG